VIEDDGLRQRAETISPGKGSLVPDSLESLPLEESRRMLQALRARQIELERENEELRRGQAELYATRARYFDLYDQAPVGYCTLSEQGLILEANLTASTLLDVPRGSLVQLPLAQFILPEDQDLYFRHRIRLFQIGGTQVCDLRMVGKDGVTFWAHLQATTAQDASGAAVYRIVMSDITERTRAEESRHAAEHRYHSLFQNLLEGSLYGLVLCQGEEPRDFMFLDVNEAFETLTGWKDVTGRKASEVIPGIHESNPEFLALFARVARTGVAERLELRLDTLGIWLSITAHCPEHGYFVALFENITQRKRQELLTRESETLAAKAQMAAYVAHEINGPMAGIKSAFTLLRTAIPAEHIYHPYVELVDREIDRITAIVRMMYELHRPNEPTSQNVAVATLLQDIATLLAPRFRSHRVSLLLDPGEPGLRGSLRANLLRQVLFNLLQNAIEATPPHGTVSCRARREGTNLEIQVSDPGPGISSRIAEKVWEPGFTTKRNALQGGMGLGLSTCRRLLESLQGSIHFENQPQGGCVFTVRIPLDWESSVD